MLNAGVIGETLQIHELSTVESLETLETEWADLWARCPEATPFQSPYWLIPWWKHLGTGQLFVLALRSQKRLAGLAPFCISENDGSGMPGRLSLLGTGVTDYLDILLEPQITQEGSTAILGYLRACQNRWTGCSFEQLRSSSPLLQAQTPEDCSSHITVQEVCPVLPLPASIQELPGRVPTHMLSKLRYYRRRAHKSASVRVEVAQPTEFQPAFERFLALHRARWLACGQGGALADCQVADFHRDAAKRLSAAGILRLFLLRFGERLQGCLYGFCHARRAFYYLAGFHPDAAPVSPGTLLIGHAIEAAIEEGATEFDFLRGRETYKYMWGARGQLNYRRELCRKRA